MGRRVAGGSSPVKLPAAGLEYFFMHEQPHGAAWNCSTQVRIGARCAVGNRFTDTAKWSDTWFQNLEPAFKLAWLYIVDNCDNAGVLDLNRRLANFQIGMAIDWDAFIVASEGRVMALDNGKVWSVSFIVFQQGGWTLNQENNAHKQILKLLKANGLLELFEDIQKQGGYKGLPSPLQAPSKGPCNSNVNNKSLIEASIPNTRVTHQTSKKSFTPPTPAEVNVYATNNGYNVDGSHFCDFYLNKGWRVGRHVMKDWQAAVRNAHRHGWCPRAGPGTPQKRIARPMTADELKTWTPTGIPD